MTVQDFIVNYSETFKFIHDRHGKAAVVALWEYLGDGGTELYEAVARDGLEGYLRQFYGEEGTCTREHVEGGAYIDECGVYHERVIGCPSVSALEARGKRPYKYYCEHCYWLYHKSLEENGFTYDAEYGLQPEDGYSKDCYFCSRRKEW